MTWTQAIKMVPRFRVSMDSEGVHANYDPAEDESADVQEQQALGGQKEVRPRHGALRLLFSVLLRIVGLRWRLLWSLFNRCISIGLRQGQQTGVRVMVGRRQARPRPRD